MFLFVENIKYFFRNRDIYNVSKIFNKPKSIFLENQELIVRKVIGTLFSYIEMKFTTSPTL